MAAVFDRAWPPSLRSLATIGRFELVPSFETAIKGTRFVLQKNPWNLSDVERGKLTDVQRTNRPLYRAYLLRGLTLSPPHR